MEVTIKLPAGGKSETLRIMDAPSLDVARLVAGCCGFFDVDMEPMGPGKVSITAYGDKRTLTTHGTTVYDASEKLIQLLAEEMA